METELEAKFPDIDPLVLRAKLKKLGATQKHPEILMRRKVFDNKDGSFRKRGGWIRVRDEGEKITMSYKQLNDRTLRGTKEIIVVVDDFEKTSDFLTVIGMELKSYQETKRETWEYNGVEVTIDAWPWVPTFAELEGSTEESVKKAATDLGLDWKIAMHGSVEPIYQMHYNVTEEEIDSWKQITFTPIPKWLEAKRK